MLTISKPLSAGQARRYHAEEFRNTQANYYSAGDRIVGQWHGRLASDWGLRGDVTDDHFERLADGRHPLTGEQLVRHQTPRESVNSRGEKTTTMEHRAGWDATFSAPKSVSLTALVGGDRRVLDAHRESVSIALDELEHYTQARLGGNHPAETTGRWIAATFEHDSARPVEGYAAPQVHTHAVVFNLTETAEGETRALQPRELYRSQAYATAVYRSELASRLKALGYEIERGEHGQPEIAGYSKAYLEASSPRRQQIEEHLERTQQHGAAAAQIAAHQTREAKRDASHEDMQMRHAALARAFGDEPARAVRQADERAQRVEEPPSRTTARAAVVYAADRNLEREAVVEERDVLRDALQRSMGDRTLGEIKSELAQRVEAGEFLSAQARPGSPDRAFTTPEMQALERETIDRMRAGQQTQRPIASEDVTRSLDRDYAHLSETQRAAVHHILDSRDHVVALDGVAGAGKTTTLAAIRDGAERAGYEVQGFAPTSRAAHQLADAGIPSSTLQRHLAWEEARTDERPRFYVLDESSLASTKQMHAFLHRLDAHDRVLLVGDARQHQAIDAGRPYEQLQDAGVSVAHLNDIVRQRDPALKDVVRQLSDGEIGRAMQALDKQGRIHEIADPQERYREIAREYAKHPDGTLVVSPDNQSRMELNQVIHRELQRTGRVDACDQTTRVLVARADITGADRQWAERYQRGDVVRYTKGSQALGLQAGEYARVEGADSRKNMLTVARANGEHLTYDPRRLQGVTVYREAERNFATGERVQFTAPDRTRHIANRELATVESIDPKGDMRLRLDSGRTINFAVRDHPHLDHGYAVTSHSSQGQTTDRVLVHVDSDRQGERLVNRRFAYVAISRSRDDARIYTNDKGRLSATLSRDTSHRSALASIQTAERSTSHGASGTVSQAASKSREAARRDFTMTR
jgi:conjugative relaxase-like TrwC/TraI family protein